MTRIQTVAALFAVAMLAGCAEKVAETPAETPAVEPAAVVAPAPVAEVAPVASETVTITAPAVTAAVPAVTCTRLQSDADAERAAFEDDADEYKYFPVVSLALGYRW